jgi:hypothetical protein
LRKAKADQIPSISSNSKQRNLSPRVSKVVRDFGRGFVEQTLLMNPDSGWEKGNVENKVGYLHRKELIPIPNYKRLAEDNRCPLKRCDEDIEHEHYDKDTFIGVLFQKDHNALHPLLSITFDTCGYTTARPTSMESSPWIREYTVT